MLKRIIYVLAFMVALSAGAHAADDVQPTNYDHVTNFIADAPTATSGSATGAATLSNFPINTAGFGKIFVWNTSPGTGNTWVYEESSDAATWFLVACADVSGATLPSTSDTTATAGIGRVCPVIGSQFRVRVSVFGSGTITELAQPRTGTASLVSPGALAGAPNLLLNGAMDFDQRNETTQFANNTYGPDQWKISWTSAATLANPVRVADAPPGWVNSVQVINVTAGSATVNAGDSVLLLQFIEGLRINQLKWGATTGFPAAVSLWLKTNQAGTTVVGVSLRNAGLNRSFVHMCTLTGTSVWNFCSFPVPAETSGTWASTKVRSLQFAIAAECGSTLQGTADAWQSSSIACTSAQTQLSTTTGATLQATAVKFENSPSPTGWVYLDRATELNMLQRYYFKTFPIGTKPAQSSLPGALCTQIAVVTAKSMGAYLQFPTQMNDGHTAPVTITTFNPNSAATSWHEYGTATDLTVSVDPATAISTTGVMIGEQTTAGGAVGDTMCIQVTADSAY